MKKQLLIAVMSVLVGWLGFQADLFACSSQKGGCHSKKQDQVCSKDKKNCDFSGKNWDKQKKCDKDKPSCSNSKEKKDCNFAGKVCDKKKKCDKDKRACSKKKNCDVSGKKCDKGKKWCDKDKTYRGERMDKRGAKGCVVSEKFFKKYRFITAHADALELSEEQRAELRRKKFDFEQNGIAQKANYEILMSKIKQELSEDQVNTMETQNIVAAHLDEQKNFLNQSIEIYAQMKALLTQDQREKMRELWRHKAKRFAGER